MSQAAAPETLGRPAPPPESAGEAAPSPALRGRALAAALDAPAELENLRDASPAEALALWFGPDRLHGLSAARVRRMLDRDIAEIDDVLARSCDAVLHHARWKALEAAWRGVRWLVSGLGGDGATRVRVLDCRWAELVRDLERASEFDQSALFNLVYNSEFGTPGGVPFSMLVGLYEVQHRPSRGHPSDDVTALRGLSRVCAAAFSPLIMGVSPAMFSADRFGDLELRQSLSTLLSDIEHRRLDSFAQSSDARFIALAAPRILLRTPYVGREAGDCGFAYTERMRGGGEDELWGNAALAIGHVCLRTFDEHRWLAAIRGTVPNEIAGGVVADLPAPAFATDAPKTALKFPLEINLSAALERDLTEASLICLKRCKDTPFLAFYNLPTLHRPRLNYTNEIAKVNAQLGSMLNYILCVSRFAHYLKVIGREWIGSMKTAEDCEIKLQRWLLGFCSAGDRLSYETKARYPLQDGRVRVRETPEKPGTYECTMHIKPHFQLDQAVSEFQLTTTLHGVEHTL